MSKRKHRRWRRLDMTGCQLPQTQYVKKVVKGWRVQQQGKDSELICSLVKSPIVYLEPIPKCKMELLMEKYPHQEWLGYLTGAMEENNFFVEDLVIPPHSEVSVISAKAEPFHIPDNCIGVIHSHNSFGAFHSGTDQDYVDANFPVSITVSSKSDELEFDTVSHVITLCGREMVIKGSVRYVQPEPIFDTKAFMKEATENIDNGKKTVYVAGKYDRGTWCDQTRERDFPAGQPPRQFNLDSAPEIIYTVDCRGRVLPKSEQDADKVKGLPLQENDGALRKPDE